MNKQREAVVSDLIGVVPDEAIRSVSGENVTRFDRAEPDAHLALPAHPTVKQQLQYYSAYADTRNQDLYLRLWHSAQPLIVEWECAALPKRDIDLDSITSPDAAAVIMWAGNVVLQHMNDLEALPKA